jgi:hypothetical protein
MIGKISRKASELSAGDMFRMHIHGEVVAATPVAGGKRIKIRIALEDQGQRGNCGWLGEGLHRGLEFTDAGHVLEFLCRPGRLFKCIVDWDDDEDEVEPVPPAPVGDLVG